MTSFLWKKSIEDSIKDELIITAITTGMFYVLKAANVKPPKASLDAMDIMKIAGGIVGGVLVGHCIFKAKHVANKITTGLRCFFILKQYATFFHCPTTAMKFVINARTCINP